MLENEDYELVPVVSDGNDQGWEVRVLQGDYVETVFRYGNVAIDGVNEQINFNFAVISSPLENIDTTDEGLQEVAGAILQSILEQSLEDGSAVIDERKSQP